MRRYFRKPIPGDASDPDSLTAQLERYLLWMETHHFAEGTVTVRRLTLSKFPRCVSHANLLLPRTPFSETSTNGTPRSTNRRASRHG